MIRCSACERFYLYSLQKVDYVSFFFLFSPLVSCNYLPSPQSPHRWRKGGLSGGSSKVQELLNKSTQLQIKAPRSKSFWYQQNVESKITHSAERKCLLFDIGMQVVFQMFRYFSLVVPDLKGWCPSGGS